MSRVLENLQPKEVFYYFEELSKIPRGSGNEREISNFMVEFAKKHNLEHIQDKALNVVIRKPATAGYENSKPVVIQGHLDMVCEKNLGTEHDFEKDPLKLRIVDDKVYADGTTLGADNGIALAYGLAILASKDIPHPAIELLATTEEETGMGGAEALDPSSIKGRVLINIDSEEEGKLLVSCSGGVRAQISLPIEWVEVKNERVPVAVRVRGLRGGHSGMEINKGRGNSNKIMGRFLMDIFYKFDFDMTSFNGGSKMNAIPREFDAVLLVDKDKVEALKNSVSEWNEVLKNELRTPDPNVRLEAEILDTRVERVFSRSTMEKAIKILFLIPNGIKSMSMDLEGLVESSTNIGVVTTSTTDIMFDSAVRSSVRTLKEAIVNEQKVLAETFNAKFSIQSNYPEWQYNPDSEVRQVFVDVFKKMYNKEPEIVAIHAGLECGLFKEKFPDMDMISLGPDLADVHTPDEHMSIPSVQRVWEYLLAVLKSMK